MGQSEMQGGAVAKRDEEDLSYDFDETEGDEYAEDDEGYEDDEFDEEGEDEEYEDDEEEGAKGGGWLRKALFALLGVVVLGAGGFYAYTNFLVKETPVEAVDPGGQYANPNAMGKVPPAPAVASEAAAPETVEATAPAAAPEVVEPTPAPAATVVAKANAGAKQPAAAAAVRPAVKPVPKVRSAAAALRPAVRHTPKATPVRLAGNGRGSYAVQCGAFSSSELAQNLSRVLNGKGFQARVHNGGQAASGAYSVRSTVVNSRARAEALKAKFAAAGHPGAIVGAGRNRYVLQLGIFSSRGPAAALSTELRGKGLYCSVAGGKARLRAVNRVLVGRFGTMGQAQAAASRIRHQGVPAIVVRGF